jgi:hypothetical protein
MQHSALRVDSLDWIRATRVPTFFVWLVLEIGAKHWLNVAALISILPHETTTQQTLYIEIICCQGSAVCQLSEDASSRATQKLLQITRNRSIIVQLFDVTRLMAKLGMPFRGHRENTDSQNKGL